MAVFIAVVTGNSPIPGPTLENVAEALEMKKYRRFPCSLISPAQIPIYGKHGARLSILLHHSTQFHCNMSANDRNIVIQALHIVALILSPANPRDLGRTLTKAMNA